MFNLDDDRLVGEVGLVTTRILGGLHPGEVQMHFQGGSASFVAYSQDEIERGASVLVVGRRPGRALDVTRFDG
jgi:membrane protein implicated in regulation of membrane protease activity